MDRIIILGGSSFIGRRLIQDLIKLKIKLIATSRKPIKDLAFQSDFVTWHLCDPQKNQSMESLIRSGDTVVNLIYAGVPDADNAIINNLIEIDKKIKLGKLIHISTACLGDVPESSIINEESQYIPYSSYETEKLRLESILINSQISTRLFIIRPSVIFGPGGKNLNVFIKRALNNNHLQNFFSILIFGSRNMNLIPVKSVTSLIINCITHKYKFPNIILASNGDSEFKMKDAINGIYKTLYGHSLLSISLPVKLSKLILSMVSRRDQYADKSFVSLHSDFVSLDLTKEELIEEIAHTVKDIKDKS